MIKKLKLKFISIIVFIISVLLIIILLIINIIMINDINKKIFNSLKSISMSNHENINPNHSPNKKHKPQNKQYLSSSNFVVKLDKNNNLIEIIYPPNTNFSNFNINKKNIKNKLISSKFSYENKIFFKENNFAYIIVPKPFGKMIVFEDISSFHETKEKLIYVSIIVYIFGIGIIIIISYFLTEWITKPVKENFDMQKEFIANASHELKTPLSIISTNLSILKSEVDNKDIIWYDNINDEVFKMNKLINQLLVLSKSEILEEYNFKDNLDLSSIVKNIVYQYDAICFEKNKILSHNIEENIYLYANKENITTILKIFIDNAIKYSNKNGNIKVELIKNKNKIYLSFFNTGIGIEEKYKEKIFDRFFRVDTSRNKEIEGYGLGLSIASKIISNNKWQIKVDSKYQEWIRFTIII